MTRYVLLGSKKTPGPVIKVKIYALDPEFYSGQDTHGRTHGLSVILGFAPALNEPLRNNKRIASNAVSI